MAISLGIYPTFSDKPIDCQQNTVPKKTFEQKMVILPGSPWPKVLAGEWESENWRSKTTLGFPMIPYDSL